MYEFIFHCSNKIPKAKYLQRKEVYYAHSLEQCAKSYLALVRAPLAVSQCG